MVDVSLCTQRKLLKSSVEKFKRKMQVGSDELILKCWKDRNTQNTQTDWEKKEMDRKGTRRMEQNDELEKG